MRDYELMVVLTPTIGDEEIPGALERIAGTIVRAGGEAQEPNTEVPWGRRRLAYPINDQREGFYAVFSFRLDPARQTQVDRELKLNEDILRYLITRSEAGAAPEAVETPQAAETSEALETPEVAVSAGEGE
ncbi:MAG: 30S ribosomal protein S6 [Chloroflexota bacterium]|nr:30S ribosomal protein S6 [Chloroflexota bacterium]